VKQIQKKRITEQLPQMWCDDCRVRIAPYEDFATYNKRTLHRQCVEKAKRRAAAPILAASNLDAAMA
jgi:hypothetical protein